MHVIYVFVTGVHDVCVLSQVYESEDFYDLTDELGILVWQDLMFSVAFYPTDAAFLNSITQEVRHQVSQETNNPPHPPPSPH